MTTTSKRNFFTYAERAERNRANGNTPVRSLAHPKARKSVYSVYEKARKDLYG